VWQDGDSSLRGGGDASMRLTDALPKDVLVLVGFALGGMDGGRGRPSEHAAPPGTAETTVEHGSWHGQTDGGRHCRLGAGLGQGILRLRYRATGLAQTRSSHHVL